MHSYEIYMCELKYNWVKGLNVLHWTFFFPLPFSSKEGIKKIGHKLARHRGKKNHISYLCFATPSSYLVFEKNPFPSPPLPQILSSTGKVKKLCKGILIYEKCGVFPLLTFSI